MRRRVLYSFALSIVLVSFGCRGATEPVDDDFTGAPPPPPSPAGDDAKDDAGTDVPLATLPPATLTVTVDANASGPAIPDDYLGLSFETGALERDNHVTGYFLDVANADVVGIFRQLGLRSLRIGGATVDMSSIVVPPVGPGGVKDFTGIDKMFAFAKAVGAKVIYSLRLLDGVANDDAEVAAHVWQSHAAELDSFAIGNEPDWKSYHYPPAGTGPDPEIVYYKASTPGKGYLEKWRRFATAVSAAAPGARLSGPDTGSNWPIQLAAPYQPTIDTTWQGKTWTANFGEDAKAWTFPNNSSLPYVTLHDYPGQAITWTESGQTHALAANDAIGGMLSRTWTATYYPALYQASATPALPAGVGYRFTEANPFTGALDGVSDSFASALWALDYLHWWAARGCRGVNFHNQQWGSNGTISYDGTSYAVLPIGYGIKAFDLGGRGESRAVNVSTHPLNLTAYAVAKGGDLYVTIINKEHGTGARDATVTVVPNGIAAPSATAIVLTSGKVGDASVTKATLGDATIAKNGAWTGTWKPATCAGTACQVTVRAASAAIVHVTR